MGHLSRKSRGESFVSKISQTQCHQHTLIKRISTLGKEYGCPQAVWLIFEKFSWKLFVIEVGESKER